MNTQINFKLIRSSTARIIILSLIAGCMFFSARSQIAIPNEPNEKTAIINYLGFQDEMLLFHVQYENNNSTRFFITIRQEDGTTIFQDSFSEKKFERKFKVPITESRKLVFTISDRKSNYTQAFEINSNMRVIEEVVVKEVN